MDNKEQINNYLCITVKYLGPTDHRGARVKLAYSTIKESVTLDRNYSTNTDKQVINYLLGKDFKIIATFDLGNGESGVLVDSYKELK